MPKISKQDYYSVRSFNGFSVKEKRKMCSRKNYESVSLTLWLFLFLKLCRKREQVWYRGWVQEILPFRIPPGDHSLIYICLQFSSAPIHILIFFCCLHISVPRQIWEPIFLCLGLHSFSGCLFCLFLYFYLPPLNFSRWIVVSYKLLYIDNKNFSILHNYLHSYRV